MESEGLAFFQLPPEREEVGECESKAVAPGSQTRMDDDFVISQLYDDVSPANRKWHQHAELIWTQKRDLLQEHLSGPAPENSIVWGTNGNFGLAMVGPLGNCLAYKQAVADFEETALRANILFRITRATSRADQDGLRAEIAELKQFGDFEKLCVELEAALDAQNGKSPDKVFVKCGKTAYESEKRDPIDFFQVSRLSFGEAMSSVPHSYTEWCLWYCSSAPHSDWDVSSIPLCISLCTAVPLVAFNETHILICYQPACEQATDQTLFVDIYPMSELTRNRKREKPWKRFVIALPIELTGTASGYLQASLSRLGVAAVGYGGAVAVFDIFQTVKDMRVVRLGPSKTNVITAVYMTHAPDQSRPIKDDESNWGRLFFGTHTGHFGCVDPFREPEPQEAMPILAAPAIEPILGVWGSGSRLVAQISKGVIGRLSSLSTENDYLLGGCVLGMATLGSLIYALELNGTIRVHSTVARCMMSFFAAPKCTIRNGQQRYIYPALHVNSTRLVACYPNGVMRTISLTKQAEELVTKQVQKTK
jgi:hypothetical protein